MDRYNDFDVLHNLLITYDKDFFNNVLSVSATDENTLNRIKFGKPSSILNKKATKIMEDVEKQEITNNYVQQYFNELDSLIDRIIPYIKDLSLVEARKMYSDMQNKD